MARATALPALGNSDAHVLVSQCLQKSLVAFPKNKRARLEYMELSNSFKSFIPEGLQGLFQHNTILLVQPVKWQSTVSDLQPPLGWPCQLTATLCNSLVQEVCITPLWGTWQRYNLHKSQLNPCWDPRGQIDSFNFPFLGSPLLLFCPHTRSGPSNLNFSSLLSSAFSFLRAF